MDFFITIFLPNNSFYFFINISLILSLILFSILNYRNKCFLGDSGCFVLVCYLSFVTVFVYNNNLTYSQKKNYLNLESIFLLFFIPGIDMLRLFLTRIYMGKNPFKPDKNHLHHKLLSCFGNFKSLIIYNSMIIVPWLLYLFSTSMLPYLIFIVLIIYCTMIVKINKSYEKINCFITGITGMVGSHLVDFILEKTDWNIYGLLRWSNKLDNIEHHLDAINKKKRLYLVYGDLTDHVSIRNALNISSPNYVFHLAAGNLSKNEF